MTKEDVEAATTSPKKVAPPEQAPPRKATRTLLHKRRVWLVGIVSLVLVTLLIIIGVTLRNKCGGARGDESLGVQDQEPTEPMPQLPEEGTTNDESVRYIVQLEHNSVSAEHVETIHGKAAYLRDPAETVHVESGPLAEGGVSSWKNEDYEIRLEHVDTFSGEVTVEVESLKPLDCIYESNSFVLTAIIDSGEFGPSSEFDICKYVNGQEHYELFKAKVSQVTN